MHRKYSYVTDNVIDHLTIPGNYCDGVTINPLNAQLNPICHLLSLLGARHILHVSRIRVNGLLLDPYNIAALQITAR